MSSRHGAGVMRTLYAILFLTWCARTSRYCYEDSITHTSHPFDFAQGRRRHRVTEKLLTTDKQRSRKILPLRFLTFVELRALRGEGFWFYCELSTVNCFYGK